MRIDLPGSHCRRVRRGKFASFEGLANSKGKEQSRRRLNGKRSDLKACQSSEHTFASMKRNFAWQNNFEGSPEVAHGCSHITSYVLIELNHAFQQPLVYLVVQVLWKLQAVLWLHGIVREWHSDTLPGHLHWLQGSPARISSGEWLCKTRRPTRPCTLWRHSSTVAWNTSVPSSRYFEMFQLGRFGSATASGLWKFLPPPLLQSIPTRMTQHVNTHESLRPLI